MTTEKLQRIKAECQRLLALERTPGYWSVDFHTPYGSEDRIYCVEGPPSNGSHEWPEFERKSDAAYVCACTGAAEAGWRSTIAAIEGLEEMDDEIQRFMASILMLAWEGLV